MNDKKTKITEEDSADEEVEEIEEEVEVEEDEEDEDEEDEMDNKSDVIEYDEKGLGDLATLGEQKNKKGKILLFLFL